MIVLRCCRWLTHDCLRSDCAMGQRTLLHCLAAFVPTCFPASFLRRATRLTMRSLPTSSTIPFREAARSTRSKSQIVAREARARDADKDRARQESAQRSGNQGRRAAAKEPERGRIREQQNLLSLTEKRKRLARSLPRAPAQEEEASPASRTPLPCESQLLARLSSLSKFHHFCSSQWPNGRECCDS